MAMNSVEVPTTQSSLVANSTELDLPEDEEVERSFYYDFILELEKNKDKNGLREIDFENLKKINENADARNFLWHILMQMYDQNTKTLQDTNEEIQKMKNELNFILDEKDYTEEGIKNFRDSLATSKTKGKVYLSEVRKTQYQNNHLTVILIILLVILVFPFLQMFNVLNNMAALILFSAGMVLIAGYAFYFLWFNIKDHDNLDFSKKAFSTIDGNLVETPDSKRECVPFSEDDETTDDAFNAEEETEEEKCVNPSELMIDSEKMREYLDKY